jgi:hypothetical protein
VDTSPPKKENTNAPYEKIIRGENRAYGITKERTAEQGRAEEPPLPAGCKDSLSDNTDKHKP